MANQNINDHYTNVGLASVKLVQCQTLFQAIVSTAKSSQSESEIISLVEDIADIGNDISGYWCEFFDDQREGLNERVGQAGAK